MNHSFLWWYSWVVLWYCSTGTAVPRYTCAVVAGRPQPQMAAEQLLGVAGLLKSGLIDRAEFDTLKGSILQPPEHTPRHVARLGRMASQLRGGGGRDAGGRDAPAGGAADASQRNLERAEVDRAAFKNMYESTRVASVGVPMSAEQLYRFDTEGYLVIPAVLSGEECAVLRDFVHALRTDDGASLDPLQRYSHSGPANFLLDHPVLVGILEAIVVGENHNLDADSEGTLSGGGITAEDMPGFLRSDTSYPFRLDGSFAQIKHAGERGNIPHAYPRVGPLFGYSCHNRKIYSGLTRVVWELNAVGEDDQATLVAPGSHKSNFVTPASMLMHDSPNMVSYSCPEGSIVLFTEALTHAGGTWRNESKPRMAIFNAYSPVMAQYHRQNTPTEVIEAMPLKRRSLFRGVWGHGGDGKEGHHANTWWDAETNHAW